MLRCTVYGNLPLALLLVGAFGCRPASDGTPAAEEPTWIKQDVTHADVTMAVGYIGEAPQAGHSFVPAARLKRGNDPVTGTMVFARLVTENREASIADESATVYVATLGGAADYYRSEPLELPPAAGKCRVEFRTVLPGEEDDWREEIEFPLAGSP